ncbi:hypothetical protein A9Q83_16935 [Alphaproteobacteria bacterium 46_93_T64]|nr:hypothetical protein A9Q83_16935 [Alphaproteobacteria bacterium 46_93_T64]
MKIERKLTVSLLLGAVLMGPMFGVTNIAPAHSMTLDVIEDDDIDRHASIPTPTIRKQVPLPRIRALRQVNQTPKAATKSEVSHNIVVAMTTSSVNIPRPIRRPAGIMLPPPPYSTGLISKNDRVHYLRAFKEVKKRNWRRALAYAKKATYSLPEKYIRWSWLRRYKGGASFEEITSFVIDNPDWPYRATLMRRAEEALINPISKDLTLAWFADRTPLTGMGMMRYGEALLENGETSKGQEWIKTAWAEGNFSKGLEKKFLKRHKKLLIREDHELRLDRLLWDRRTVDAIRLLERVSTEKKRLAIARIRLMRMKGNVDAAIRQVPKAAHSDPGFMFDRIKWRRRKGMHEEARDLLLKVGNSTPYPEIWWREREIQARKLLRLGHISQAYRLSAKHGMTSGGKFASAEWLSGWISLRFLHDYEVALTHFTRLYDNVTYPISRARGAYWVGRTYAAMKDKNSAAYWYEEASKYGSTFYGQVAMSELDLKQAPDLKRNSSTGMAAKLRLDNHEQVMVIRHLAELGQEKWARPFLLKLTEDAAKKDDYVYLGQLARDIGRPDYSVAVAKRASQLGTELPDTSWPTHSFSPANPAIEKALIMAITRQESAFATDAISPAGARGLMQLMPRTARAVSKRLKLPYSKSNLIRDPEYNTLLGSTYLGGLIDRHDGSYILAIASYNAGSSRVRSWIKDWGDPRRGDINTLDWIELIPFSETRNYVQRVMENLQVYRQLVGDGQYRVVQIGTDLARGNSAN